MSASAPPGPPGPPPTVPSVLLPELLGFIPQFLLDDIINIANDEARQSVDAMEQFLQRWADARADKPPSSSSSSNTKDKDKDADWDPTQEIEQGLVAFQTLLESHVDVAFDFFEAWSMRNIFAVPADLPVVAPHQAGLDLDGAADQPEREGELLAEIDELRRKVHAVRQNPVFVSFPYFLCVCCGRKPPVASRFQLRPSAVKRCLHPPAPLSRTTAVGLV
ncbi:Mis12 protein-domain-containing protein, partial [Ganoderma leucocontextum]